MAVSSFIASCTAFLTPGVLIGRHLNRAATPGLPAPLVFPASAIPILARVHLPLGRVLLPLVQYQTWLGGACRINRTAQPSPVAAREFNEVHPVQRVGVALVTAAHAEVKKRTAGRDFAIGQPALETGDDKLDAPNLLGKFRVLRRQRKHAHLI